MHIKKIDYLYFIFLLFKVSQLHIEFVFIFLIFDIYIYITYISHKYTCIHNSKINKIDIKRRI